MMRIMPTCCLQKSVKTYFLFVDRLIMAELVD